MSITSMSFPYKRLRVFPDRDLRATFLELVMVDTRIFQRLRNTKQLGNSNISYPTAEHSRFSHSLGVLYWVSKILASLNENFNKDSNKEKLKKMDDLVRSYLKMKLVTNDPDHTSELSEGSKIFDKDSFLGVSWFEQLARLYGLLHDISHIPYGHTIEDQACLFERHDDDLGRLNSVFEMLKNEVAESHHFKSKPFSESLVLIAQEYVNLVKLMFVMGYITNDYATNDTHRNEWLHEWKNIDDKIKQPLLLTYDIVSNTICADLMDYTLRDTLFSSMPKTFDKVLLTCMKIVDYKTTFFANEKQDLLMPRLGVSVARKKIRHDIITAILDLLRIRYDLTEKVYYHHTKVAVDAMLEKVLRSIPEDLFKPQDIYDRYLGDEGFLNLLETKIKELGDDFDSTEQILQKVFNRNLYKAVFRINKDENLNKIGKDNLEYCNKAKGDKEKTGDKGRNEIENEIILELGQKAKDVFQHGDVIISYPPVKMQRKIAKALIEWSNGRIFPFESLPREANYSNEVGLLTERYQSLWSMTVYLNPDKIHYVRLVESVCENIFETRNESILKNYLKETYKTYYASQKNMVEIDHKVISSESKFIFNQAAKGLGHMKEVDLLEMTENMYENVINESRKERKPRPKESPSGKKRKVDEPPPQDNSAPFLGFDDKNK